MKAKRKPLVWIDDGKGGAAKLEDRLRGQKIDELDYLMVALLSDPVYCAEILGEHPENAGGVYRVWDYQYGLFRLRRQGPYAGAACGRSVGKTESIKWRGTSHAFRRLKRNMLITAPELIHLEPLTDAIETIYRNVRLLRDMLDTRYGQTGFTHRPWSVNLRDGTKLVGRIPRLDGRGVKGQHQPDLIIDEAQDYPDKGWTEVHETVMKDTRDRFGRPDFTYHFYGVHSGTQGGGMVARTKQAAFKIVRVTALQRPSWGREEKAAAKAAYGGTSAPDYRRNILGEPGGAAHHIFAMARLVACMDQDPDSRYNAVEVVASAFTDSDNPKKQLIRVEDFDDLYKGTPVAEAMKNALDLPAGYRSVWGGMDIGLSASVSVIHLYSHQRVKVGGERVARDRLKLFRRIHLERMRTRQLREAMYAVAWAYGGELKGFGVDSTGIGFPIMQEMQDDEARPPALSEDVLRGYFFNAKVPVGVEKQHVTEDSAGRMRDQFGSAVVREEDPLSGLIRYVTYMPMIEASTRYLREWVDNGFLLLPFDPEITTDMQGETQQRVQRISGLKNKPNAFHDLDAMRTASMVFHAAEMDAALEYEERGPVLDRVGDFSIY